MQPLVELDDPLIQLPFLPEKLGQRLEAVGQSSTPALDVASIDEEHLGLVFSV